MCTCTGMKCIYRLMYIYVCPHISTHTIMHMHTFAKYTQICRCIHALNTCIGKQVHAHIYSMHAMQAHTYRYASTMLHTYPDITNMHISAQKHVCTDMRGRYKRIPPLHTLSLNMASSDGQDRHSPDSSSATPLASFQPSRMQILMPAPSSPPGLWASCRQRDSQR